MLLQYYLDLNCHNPLIMLYLSQKWQLLSLSCSGQTWGIQPWGPAFVTPLLQPIIPIIKFFWLCLENISRTQPLLPPWHLLLHLRTPLPLPLSHHCHQSSQNDPINTEVRSPSPCSDSSEALEALELLQSCALDLKSLTWSAFPLPLLYFWTHVLLLFPMLTPISACLEHPGPRPPLVLFQILTQCHPLCTAFSDQTPYNCKTTPIMTFQPACLTSSFLLAPTAYTHCIFYLLTHYLSSPYNIFHEGRYFSSFLFAALPSLPRKMSGIE